MENLIGLKLTLECPDCGTPQNVTAMAANIKSLKSGLAEPRKCKCKSKNTPHIIKLEQIEYIQQKGVNK